MIKPKLNRDCDYKPCGKNFKKFKTTDKYCSRECETKAKSDKLSERETKNAAMGKIMQPLLDKAKRLQPIRKVSKKLQGELTKYSQLRKEFLEANPICEANLEGCTKEANQVHHAKGRGIYLNTVEYFRAICDNCHRIAELNPIMAKEKGLSVSRLTK